MLKLLWPYENMEQFVRCATTNTAIIAFICMIIILTSVFNLGQGNIKFYQIVTILFLINIVLFSIFFIIEKIIYGGYDDNYY